MADHGETGMGRELEGVLDSARCEGGGDARLSQDELDGLYSTVDRRVQAAEARPGFWWKTRSTFTRRLLALGSFGLLATCMALFAMRPDVDTWPLWRLVAELGSLALLLVVSVLLAIRPTHRPEPAPWISWTLVGVSLAATFVLAALPPPHAGAILPEGMGPVQHAMPCFAMGLLLGVPIYALARLLDRGTPLSAIVAAAAAGIAGNALLQMHCPVNEPAHNLAGHFTVVFVFVAGVLVVEWIRRRRRSA